MKLRLLLGFILSSLLFTSTVVAQDSTSNKRKKDTVSYKLPKAFTLGVDISYPIRYAFDKDVKGFEVVGDLRLSNNWYIAAEAGYSSGSKTNEYLDYTIDGPYFKLGFNYNIIKFSKPTNNSFYVGARGVYSMLNTDVNNYKIRDDYWGNSSTGSFSPGNSTVYSLDLVVGMKVEMVKNFIMGWTIRGAFPVSSTMDESFDDLYIPGVGFKKDFIFNFNYTLSYMLPFGKVKNAPPKEIKK